MIDLQKVFIDICYTENITKRKIIEQYNKKYCSNLREDTFHVSVKRGVMKFNQLQNVLDAIGYEVIIRKKI